MWAGGKLIPSILLVFSLLELLGALLHSVSWPDELPPRVRLGISAILFVAALVTLWHHHRLRIRIERHQGVLASMRFLCSEALTHCSRHADPEERIRVSGEFIHDILYALIVSLEHKRKVGMMNASLVARRTGGPFKILDQFPSGTFLASTSLDPDESAAAIAAAQTRNSLVYIPSTRYVHGILMAFEKTYPIGEKSGFMTARIIENAFQSIDRDHEKKVLRSLICTQITNEIGGDRRFDNGEYVRPDSTIVLSLGAEEQVVWVRSNLIPFRWREV